MKDGWQAPLAALVAVIEGAVERSDNRPATPADRWRPSAVQIRGLTGFAQQSRLRLEVEHPSRP